MKFKYVTIVEGSTVLLDVEKIVYAIPRSNLSTLRGVSSVAPSSVVNHWLDLRLLGCENFLSVKLTLEDLVSLIQN